MKKTTTQLAQPAIEKNSMPLALIAAGGEGKRLGADGPKALVLCSGRSLLAWCLDAFAASERFGQGRGRVVVAAHASVLDEFEAVAAPVRSLGLDLLICEGGSSRSHSVRRALIAGLAGAVADDRPVLVHDAARPLVTAELIDGIHGALVAGSVDGLVAANPVVDTIKRADAELIVTETPPRESLWAVQTPQAFRADSLAKALMLDGPVDDERLAGASDDASLVEANGGKVAIYPWRELNLKVTGQNDLAAAERQLSVD